MRRVHDSTSPHAHRMGIRITLCRFRSPLLTASRLISFPLPTKMLQFGRFPFAPCGANDHRSDLDVQFSGRRIRGSLRLPAAFRSLTRPSSAPKPSHSPGGVTAVGLHRLDWRPALRMQRPSSRRTSLPSTRLTRSAFFPGARLLARRVHGSDREAVAGGPVGI